LTDNQQMTKRNYDRITLRLPEALGAQARTFAELRGGTLTAYLIEAVRDGVGRDASAYALAAKGYSGGIVGELGTRQPTQNGPADK